MSASWITPSMTFTDADEETEVVLRALAIEVIGEIRLTYYHFFLGLESITVPMVGDTPMRRVQKILNSSDYLRT